MTYLTDHLESAVKRDARSMCRNCYTGVHSGGRGGGCRSDGCPCVCNDADFKFPAPATPFETRTARQSESGAGEEPWDAHVSLDKRYAGD